VNSTCLNLRWGRPMISGMVELLTAHRAAGWAHAGDDARAPLAIRARYGKCILAQIELRPASQEAGGQGEPGRPADRFQLEFTPPLEQKAVREISIEAAIIAHNQDWQILPRQLMVGVPLPDYQLPAPADLLFRSERDRPLAGPNPRYWSSQSAKETSSRRADHPVFVLGAARSGTTAICRALESGTRYRGFPEGHALDVAIRIALAVNAHFQKKEQWMSPLDIASYHLGKIGHSWLREECIGLIRRLADGFTTPFWFDKTPTYQMVASVPLLAEAWPNARFIFMKRRGLENLRSRLRRFPGLNFSDGCKDWNIIMSGWRAIRAVVRGRFAELDQRTMLESPEASAVLVGRLLDLEPAEVKGLSTLLRGERPESTGQSSSFIADVSELGWSAPQIETFRQICGAEMEAYGYTYDEMYCRIGGDDC